MLNDKKEKSQDAVDQELDDLLKDFHEQDDLHQRIQQFKKKKAAADTKAEQIQFKEAVSAQEERQEASALDRLKEIQQNEEKNAETKVIHLGNDDVEKTLVMNAPLQKEAEEQEDSNATVIIGEEDMRHLVEEEERRKEQKKNKKKNGQGTKKSALQSAYTDEESGDDSRLNKIITYVIIAILAIGVLVGLFFGVKAIIGGGTETKDDPQQGKTEVIQPSDSDVIDSDESGGTQITTNHDKEISEINGQIKSYQEEVSYYQSLISSENEKIENAQKAVEKAKTALDTALSNVQAKQDEITNLIAQQNAATDESEKAAIQEQIDTAVKERDDLDSKYKQAGNSHNSAKREYDSVKRTSQSNIDDYNDKIDDLNSKISDLQSRLSALQS